MITFDIPLGKLYKDWDTIMNVTVRGSSMTFTEQLHNLDFNTAVAGRTLTVNDAKAFEKATGTSTEDLESFLIDKKANGILSIDHLQRLCERHIIPYNLSGDRPVTAHRKHIKCLRDTSDEREIKAINLCRKAIHRISGGNPGIPKNHEAAVALLTEAISFGYLPAFHLLAKFYKHKGMEQEAMETAGKGAGLGDARSMIWLARWLCKEPYRDYNRAAKLFIAASDKGEYYAASKGLHYLISEGYFTPKSNLFMKLLICAARSERISPKNNNIPFNPQLRMAREILLRTTPDIPMARELLNKALEDGKTMAYGGLAKCDILEKRWGHAVENAMKGIEAGVDGDCLIYATRLALEGADFVNFTDELGAPDYEAVVAWSLRCIEEDLVYGFQMLYHLAEIGALKMEDVLTPELAERCTHYIDNMPEERRADIYCRPFDGKRQPGQR